MIAFSSSLATRPEPALAIMIADFDPNRVAPVAGAVAPVSLVARSVCNTTKCDALSEPIDDVLRVPPDSLPVHKPPFLGLATVRAMQRRWSNESNALWDQLEFVHYTEADQVLHLRARHAHKLFAPFRAKGPKLGILTPHRLNAVPRAQDVDFLRRAFDPPADGRALPEEPPPEVEEEVDSILDIFVSNIRLPSWPRFRPVVWNNV